MTAAMIGLLGNGAPKVASDVLNRFRNRRQMAKVLQRHNRRLLATDDDFRSIARCGNALGGSVHLRRYQDGRVRPAGVASCKSVWGCLGCAARKRAEKAAVVKYYVDAHLAAGKGCSLGSFTLAHYLTDRLADLLEGLRRAFTDMRHLKVYRDAEAEYGIIGWIAALEITYGVNGWHPHLHVLFFHEQHLEVEYGENAGLHAALWEAFSRQIDRHLDRPVHQVYGVDLVPVKTEADGDDRLAKYLGKIQLEMTRQDLKTGRVTSSRSPWQVGLDAAETGDAQDSARWLEYLRATKGRQVVTIGGDLAKHYGKPTPAQISALATGADMDDQADENDDEGDIGEDIASMDADVWTDLLRNHTDPTRSAVAGALTVLEEQDIAAMAHYVSDWLGKPIEVHSHPTTGLPNLRYRDRADRRRIEPEPRARRRYSDDDEEIDINQLGPVARAWYRATRRSEEVNR